MYKLVILELSRLRQKNVEFTRRQPRLHHEACFTSNNHLTQHPTEDVSILKLKEAKAKQEMEAQRLWLSERSSAAATVFSSSLTENSHEPFWLTKCNPSEHRPCRQGFPDQLQDLLTV